MLEPSRNPDNHFQHWLGTSLNDASRKDFILTCRLEIDLLQHKERHKEGSAGLMPASLAALIEFLEQKSPCDEVGFLEIKRALAVSHIEPFVTVVNPSSPSSVIKAFEGPSTSCNREDQSAGLLRSIEILTVIEIIGNHFIEIAALQIGDKDALRAYSKAYKGCPMAPCLQNAWFFANGVVRASYEAEYLARLAPRSPLVEHKRQLSVHFFDGLSDCLSLSCGGDSPEIAKAVRENLRERARFLGYPEC